jgi:PhzF family phenazine biosynthesis protein
MRIRLVDAFTDRPFGGNPAGVCVVEEWPGDDRMQHVADELGAPMTAFLRGSGDELDLRWFMPVGGEQPICGHATLAAAHAIAEDRGGAPVELRFSTLSGVHPARTHEDGAVTIEFPLAPVREIPAPHGLAAALGATPVETHYAERLPDVVAVFESEAQVRALAPDFVALGAFSHREGLRGISATAPADDGSTYEIVSRFFSPGDGLDEDPVTGSAHCAIAPYWAARLGRDELTGLQASARTGLLHCALRGDRVALTGRAVTVLEGELRD